MKANPFCFFLSALCLVTATVTAADWPRVMLASPGGVELAGPVGAALERGVERLSQPPYTTDWLLADVSFKLNRAFTNYSGDVSGRFLELASLTSLPGHYSPPTLQPALAEIAKYQRADGHFGGELNFSEPMHNGSATLPMFWGNARLLVGLVTAARECNRPDLLAQARRLGDFYLATTNIFCSPARKAEMRATGSGGDSYTCCYFPAIESLALLYRATHDERYLQAAEGMAEWFKGFDALPIDHSHGDLCAWRGILELYGITGQRAYLERALAKWEQAVQNSFVWSLGGVGECWYVFYHHDEGCSESDWLRFNLQLWQFTGQTRFLDMAERNLLNQYAANQCPNGGYGVRQFDGEPTGPIGTRGEVGECNYCCSFHGPLGLHFLKSYLAAGSDLGVFVNFPLDFASTVKSCDRDWHVTASTRPATQPDEKGFDVELAPADGAKSARTTLWVRRPNWATGVKLTDSAGAALPFSEEGGYVRLKRKFKRGERLHIAFQSALRLEKRRFEPASVAPGRISRLREVALLDGPNVLLAAPASGTGRLTLLAQVDSTGRLSFWPAPQGGYLTVALPGFDVDLDQVTTALASAVPITLRPESELTTGRRMTFIQDLIVVPANALSPSAANSLAARAEQAAQALSGPFFGQHLELKPDIWIGANGWQFASNALEITGGDVGLLDGQGYADYRFEFDLELPLAGQGVTGWIVRAKDASNCLLFQIQSADSTYNPPEWKTRPNTLRPHVRHDGEWVLAEPVALPKKVRRGETHHIVVECRGSQITVLLDGEKVLSQEDAGLRAGAVGFRAAGSTERGLFRNISLEPSRPNPPR
jgi:DUF1680 family protein